jgi:hypothetical protein
MRRYIITAALAWALLWPNPSPAIAGPADDPGLESPPAGTAVTVSAETVPTGPLAEAEQAEDYGFTLLSKRPIKPGWGAVFDVVSTGDRLVAVGYSATYDTSRGSAWTSKGGRKWRETHTLPNFTFDHALAMPNASVLAFRGTRCGAAAWRLRADGTQSGPELVWTSKKGCRGRELEAVAGDRRTGIVGVFGEWFSITPASRIRYGDDETTQVVWRTPHGRWRPVDVPGVRQSHPFDVVRTTSGFVLIGEGRDGLLAWRSPNGRTWTEPEILPASDVSNNAHALRETVYDERQDILLVLADPDRIWRSSQGGAFVAAGPLPASLRTDDSAFAGVALDDGFLVVSSDDEGMRWQTSPHGAEWTLGLPGPGAPQPHIGWLVRHRDGVIALGYEGGPVMRGPSTIEAYRPRESDGAGITGD